MVHWKTLTAIGAILILESIALFLGHNGTMYTASIVAIAGLGGYTIHEVKNQILKPKD